MEGQVPYDLMLSQVTPDLLKMELDLAWATKANQNPVELFKKHQGRFPIWHVKDLDKTSKNPVEIGNGYIDFKPIFKAADIAGMKYFFVEQDGASKPLESVKTSYQNLSKILV